MIKCSKHSSNEAVTVCSMCGKGACKECKVRLVGRNYCQSCADDLVKKGAIVSLKKLYDVLKEKRKKHRVHVLVPAVISVAGEKAATYKSLIHNISASGVGVISDKPVDLNSIAFLNFKLPNGSVLKDVQGGVIRSEKIGVKYSLGILFMNIPEKQKLIDNFIFDAKKHTDSESTAIDMSNFVM
ncbi:MAG: PilZ domain-containing protein [Candidatus Firestonebacteria bacterium]